MKRLIKLSSLLALALAFASLSSCALLGFGKTVTIENVGWYIETIAPDRWGPTVVNKPKLSYSFEVYFKEDLSPEDIESARVYLPIGDSFWTLDPAECFDADARSIGYGMRYWYSGNDNELPIGTLTAEIVLTNGKSSRYSFTMGRPGSISTDGCDWVYSKQDEPVPASPSNSFPAIMRPEVNGLSLENGQLKTVFTVRGGNVRNGWVWYYDSSDHYVGKSMYFFDQKALTSSGNFLKGYFDSAADGENTLLLDPGDITKSDGTAITASEMAGIAHCRLYVTDGAQYNDLPLQYDYRAMSLYY